MKNMTTISYVKDLHVGLDASEHSAETYLICEFMELAANPLFDELETGEKIDIIQQFLYTFQHFYDVDLKTVSDLCDEIITNEGVEH